MVGITEGKIDAIANQVAEKLMNKFADEIIESTQDFIDERLDRELQGVKISDEEYQEIIDRSLEYFKDAL